MKKHEMVLDFTSLLDVILIILFLVLCTMNGKAQKDADTIDDLTQANVTMAAQLEEQAGQIEDLENTNKELAGLLEEMEAIKKENSRLEAENAKLDKERNEALERLDKYMEISGLDDYDSLVFDTVMKGVTSVEVRILYVTKEQADVELFQKDARSGEYRQVGNTLSINPSLSLVNNNANMVQSWLEALLSKNMSQNSESTVVLILRYSINNDPAQGGVANSAVTAVDNALKAIEKNDSKGYTLYRRTIEEK